MLAIAMYTVKISPAKVTQKLTIIIVTNTAWLCLYWLWLYYTMLVKRNLSLQRRNFIKLVN